MQSQRALKLVHIITGLGQGGAETMLYKLLVAMDDACCDTQVISLLDQGVMGPHIQALGIPVIPLHMRPGIPDPRALLKLRRILRVLAPDLVQTWMYHADLIGGLAAHLAGIHRLVWNIRQSDQDPRSVKRSTRHTTKACALLSARLPDHIVCCSRRAREIHATLGYRDDKISVIPNGFDLQDFRPDPSRGRCIRTELELNEHHMVFGLVARFDPQKDHRGFIQAARLTVNECPDARFLLCGTDVDRDNTELTTWIHEADLVQNVHLLGCREDMPAINNALNLAVSASAYGEGFPNVLGEAMACGVPCVVTDVGDSARIVGNTGRVVPPRDPAALAQQMLHMVLMDTSERLALGRAARKRVEENYSMESIAAQYTTLYRRLLSSPLDSRSI